jgi:hypothetical protein
MKARELPEQQRALDHLQARGGEVCGVGLAAPGALDGGGPTGHPRLGARIPDACGTGENLNQPRGLEWMEQRTPVNLTHKIQWVLACNTHRQRFTRFCQTMVPSEDRRMRTHRLVFPQVHHRHPGGGRDGRIRPHQVVNYFLRRRMQSVMHPRQREIRVHDPRTRLNLRWRGHCGQSGFGFYVPPSFRRIRALGLSIWPLASFTLPFPFSAFACLRASCFTHKRKFLKSPIRISIEKRHKNGFMLKRFYNY